MLLFLNIHLLDAHRLNVKEEVDLAQRAYNACKQETGMNPTGKSKLASYT